MRLQVDTLNKVIAEKNINTFYTSVNPSDYYNKQAKPIALKHILPLVLLQWTTLTLALG